jgi:hypothetical protein
MTWMELLLYLAMGVVALLFAVVLVYLIAWTIRRFSGAPHIEPDAGTTADRQPDTGSVHVPGSSTSGRRS